MTEASANYGKNSPVRSNALAQRYGGLYLGDRVYGGKQNPDVDPPGFDAGIAGEAETEQNTVTVDYEKVTDIRSAIVDAVQTKSTEDEDIIIAIVNYPISEKENLDAVLESQYVRHPSYVSVKDQKLNYFIVILQSRGHIGLVRAIMFRLKKKLGDRTDYDVEKADEGSLYECTVVSDIGVLSLFKKVYYNKINGAYKSGCSPTVFEIAWMQSTADAKGKVELLHQQSKLQCEQTFCVLPEPRLFKSEGPSVGLHRAKTCLGCHREKSFVLPSRQAGILQMPLLQDK